jgi:hypothetical protein
VTCYTTRAAKLGCGTSTEAGAGGKAQHRLEENPESKMPSLFKKIFGGGKGKGDSSTGKASTDNVASGADRAATTQKMQPQQSEDLPDKSSPEIQAVLDAAAAENAAAAGMQQAQQGVKCKAGAHGASYMHSVQRQRVHDKHAPTLTPQETASLAQRSVKEPARASTANMSAPMAASMDGGEKGVRCPDTGKWYTESEIIALEAAKKKEGMAKNETAPVYNHVNLYNFLFPISCCDALL